MITPVFALFVIIAILFLVEKDYSKPNIFVLSAIFITMLLIITFRDITMADAANYIENFNNSNVEDRFEVGYMFVRNTVKSMSNNYQHLFLTVGALALFIKFCAIRAISPFIYGSLLVYLSYFFILHDMIQIRAGLAVGFLLLAIKYITEQNPVRFIIAALAATLFHTSSIVIFPLWFIPHIKLNRFFWISIIPACYALVIIGGVSFGKYISYIPIPQVQILYERYMYGMEWGNNNIINIFNMLLIGKVFVCSFLILCHKKIEQYFPPISTWLMIYTISLSVYILCFDIPVVAIRVSELLQIVELIIIPTIVFTMKERFIGKFIVISISLVFLLGIIFINEYLL